MTVVSILHNSITHAHTYVIVVLCVPVATHEHLPSQVEIYILVTIRYYIYDILFFNGKIR